MTVTLELKPELEAGLSAEAQASGKTLEEFIVSLVEGVILAKRGNINGHQRAAAYEAWSAGHRSTSPLSDHAVSRDAMYEVPND